MAKRLGENVIKLPVQKKSATKSEPKTRIKNIGQRGSWTPQAIQQIVKKYLKQLGLYESGKAVHALRHSYGVELYSREKDLRAVQKQLRHRSIQSTLIYADVTEQDIQNQLKGLWN